MWCNWVCSCVSLCVSEVWLKRQNVNRPRPLTTFKCLPSTKSHGLPVILRRLWRRYLALPELLQVLFSDTESSIVVFPNVVDSNPLYVNFVVICIKWMKLTSKFNCAHKPTSTILNTLCALIAQRSVLAPVLVHRATILCVLWLHSGLYLALCWCTGPQYFVCFDCTAVCTWPCAGAHGRLHSSCCLNCHVYIVTLANEAGVAVEVSTSEPGWVPANYIWILISTQVLWLVSRHRVDHKFVLHKTSYMLYSGCRYILVMEV